jgi:hypothetical protein
VEVVGRWRGIRWQGDPELRDVITVGHVGLPEKMNFCSSDKIVNRFHEKDGNPIPG